MIFLRNLHITKSSVCIVSAIKEQEEVRLMTSSFSDKGRAAVLDRPAEISPSEIQAIILVLNLSILAEILCVLFTLTSSFPID